MEWISFTAGINQYRDSFPGKNNMKYIVKLTNELTVEAKDKSQAAKIAAKHFSEVLKGNSPKNSRGDAVNHAHFYCMPDVYTGIEGQGQNEVCVQNYNLKIITA